MRTSPPTTPPTIRLRSPGEIVSAVPYLLGFSPQSSLVLIGLEAKRIVLTCRVDLADVPDVECTDTVVEAFLRADADRALLVAYEADRGVTAAALEAVTERLDAAGVRVLEQISVVGDRWFDEVCTDERCCPPDGMAVSEHDDAPSTMSFHALAGGFRADRAALVAECHPDRPLLLAAIRSELEVLLAQDAELNDEDVLAALTAVLGWGTGGPAGAAQIAVAAVAVADPLIRDVCYAVVAPGLFGEHLVDLHRLHRPLRRAGAAAGDLDAEGILLDSDARDRVLSRLLAWVRNLPDDVPAAAVHALVVAAAAHWGAGDGARARTLVERAHALDVPCPPMLATLTSCLSHGFRPPELGRLSGASPGPGRQQRSIA